MGTVGHGDGAAIIPWTGQLLPKVYPRVLNYHHASHRPFEEGLSLGVNGEVQVAF